MLVIGEDGEEEDIGEDVQRHLSSVGRIFMARKFGDNYERYVRLEEQYYIENIGFKTSFICSSAKVALPKAAS